VRSRYCRRPCQYKVFKALVNSGKAGMIQFLCINTRSKRCSRILFFLQPVVLAPMVFCMASLGSPTQTQWLSAGHQSTRGL
jgi:hypothetical protein